MRSCGICPSPSGDPATTSRIVLWLRRPHAGSGRRRVVVVVGYSPCCWWMDIDHGGGWSSIDRWSAPPRPPQPRTGLDMDRTLASTNQSIEMKRRTLDGRIRDWTAAGGCRHRPVAALQGKGMTGLWGVSGWCYCYCYRWERGGDCLATLGLGLNEWVEMASSRACGARLLNPVCNRGQEASVGRSDGADRSTQGTK